MLHGILSQQDDDTARAAVESAQSNLEAMENAVKGAQDALARARALADFEQIRSPIDGTITARNVEVGNLVSASEAALGLPTSPAGSTGAPLTGGAQGGELFSVVAVPLLSFSSPGLSPLSVDPITSTVSSSYNTSRVLEGSHSLSLSPTPYSGGSPVPGFDAHCWAGMDGCGGTPQSRC